MRTLTALLSTAALALCTASGALAQNRPDFSGTWTLDPASAPVAPAEPPQQLTLTQDANTLTMSWTQEGRKTTETLNLDGSESKTPTRGGGVDGQPRTGWITQKATWEANRIVVVEGHKSGEFEAELRRVFSMDGDKLVFEVEVIKPKPPDGNPSVMRVVYRRSEGGPVQI
jgi:YD repeat-containing protein